MYGCVVDLQRRRLQILKYFTAAGGGVSVLAETADNVVPEQGPYRVRVVAIGPQHSCSVVGSSVGLSVNHTFHTAGTVGVVVRNAKVCFDYLWVVAPFGDA
jgi:hypothetical protein